MSDKEDHIPSSFSDDDDDYNPELQVTSVRAVQPSSSQSQSHLSPPSPPSAQDVHNDVPTNKTLELENISDSTTTAINTNTTAENSTATAIDNSIAENSNNVSDNTISRPVKTVKFDDNTIEIESKNLTSSGEEAESPEVDENSDNSIDDDVLQVIDDNEDNEYDPLSTPHLPSKPHDAKDFSNKIHKTLLNLDEKYSNINVTLFNEIIQYFITSTLFNDPNFNSLSPTLKEAELINKFQNETGKSINPLNVNINFNATTSYNKSNMKPNEETQLLVPINPFCRRPDISLPMTHEERYEFDEFRKEAEKHSKEFECLNFPAGSRLFVGNLAVNSLKISDVWRIFKKYGDVKAVNMKQGYGFVQFTQPEASTKAIKGEEHVPLHNRLMHLEVSKTHEKHIVKGIKEIEKSKDRSRAREREKDFEKDREFSPQRNFNERQRSPIRKTSKSTNNKIRVIISAESDAGFNHLLVNSLNEVGLQCSIKHVETTADEVPQETITESAYAGVCATVVTNRMEMVNLFLFERDSDDGAIKFDEYESISIESTINFILEHMKKSSKYDSSINNNNINNHFSNNKNEERNNHRNDINRNNNLRNNRDNNRGRDRDRNKNNNNNNYRNDRRNNNNNNNRNDRRNNGHNNNNNYYNAGMLSPRDQIDQRQGYSRGTSGPQYGSASNMGQQQYQYQPQQQQQYDINYDRNNYNNQHQSPNQQQYYQNHNNSNSNNNNNNTGNIATQLMTQLTSLDQSSLQNMLSLVTQQQQQQQRQQNPVPPQYQPNQVPSHYQQPQYGISQYGSPQQAPQQYQQNQGSSSGQGVAALYSQLQNMPVGSNVNYNNLPNNSASPPIQNKDNNEDTSKLFETLARLKNNM